MGLFGKSRHAHLMLGAAVSALTLGANAAFAETRPISIAPQALASALHDFGAQTGRQIMFTPESADAKMSRGVDGVADEETALAQLLAGTGLTFRREANVFIVMRTDAAPQSGSAAGDGADSGTVEALIVTAQKREEDIQDVPIAISAFTQEALERSQVAGGPDLMTQVPNMTFTKTNFTGYSIQLRGIGTQAISATTDAAVAVAFNNTPFIRNRFFEQEFYDLQRVEVLRGPQGTLYGRNATAGVVNIISAKPSFGYEAKLSGDVANYNSTRIEGMVNLPLVDDKVAMRLAGAWTKRDGYATNDITGNPIDGRDLWSTRLSLGFAPTDTLRADLIWEHFEEDDDRLRSGKQLCKTHEITDVAGIPVGEFDSLANIGQGGMYPSVAFSQGCLPASLYADESFQKPNGLSLPYYYMLSYIGVPVALMNPYASREQSRDLRVIESGVDPRYKAKTDAVELQFNWDFADQISLASETAYLVDEVFSTQDYNRFNTATGAWVQPDVWPGPATRPGVLLPGPSGGIFCDPQLGCSDRMLAVDLATARSRQFSQELRLSSDYDGPFNFSLGANFLRYDTEDKYYVFINSLTLYAANAYTQPAWEGPPYVVGEDNTGCLPNGMIPPNPGRGQEVEGCVYIDPNPIENLNDQGHNYFLSRNPYKLISYAAFGEAYYRVNDALNVTAGLRWTVDKKEAPRIPSWVLAARTVGYPIAEVVEQEWREPTGRLAIDWKPDLAFTDETLVYASYAHGYKAGGANPPTAGIVCRGCNEVSIGLVDQSATNPKTFAPEFVDAFEVGSKNTLFDGRLTVNLAAFYYDYEGYQISQIVNRAAVNLNIDADVAGLEVEIDWRPVENLRLGFKGGYESTRIADGEQAIDLMDRTAGDPDWLVVRPFPTFTANCILPKWLMRGINPDTGQPIAMAMGGVTGGNPGGCELAYVLGLDPVTQLPYVPNPDPADVGYSLMMYHPNYPGWNPEWAPNNGEGFFKQLGGNELPNAPDYTATFTVDYTVPLASDWLMTLHTDLYYQSEAWTRVFNTEGYDKLKAYTNVNLAAIFTNDDAGWKVMAYVKNVFDRDSITGSFLNSDDTGLTTNIFLTEPRLYGLRATKEWTGGPWWTGANAGHTGPYALTIEVGGAVQRQSAPFQPWEPSFAGKFSDALDPARMQDDELDWGDGREVRVTYAPDGPWSVAISARFGRTNGTKTLVGQEFAGRACAVSQAVCDSFVGDPLYEVFSLSLDNSLSGDIARQEEYTLVDFAVGRDVGFGRGLTSSLQGGLRYAEFRSSLQGQLAAAPEWDIPPEYLLMVPARHTDYQASVNGSGRFEGAGPVLSWEAAQTLFDGDDAGRVDLDWSLEGGVIFGKQMTRFESTEEATDLEVFWPGPYSRQASPPVTTTTHGRRSKSATAPVLGASVGLAYEIQRVRIAAGYRWERYFDVLDVGFDEREEADRTIDGPYFKLAIGFGG